MYGSNEEHGKPMLDPEKAPYGHVDAPPLATVPTGTETPSVVSLAAEQLKGASDALHSFADDDGPVFPPVNVGFANPEDSPLLPSPTTHSPEAQAAGDKHHADSFRLFVKANPVASLLVAAVFGTLLVRVLLARGESRM